MLFICVAFTCREIHAFGLYIHDIIVANYSGHPPVCNKLTFFAYPSISNYAKHVNILPEGNSMQPL